MAGTLTKFVRVAIVMEVGMIRVNSDFLAKEKVTVMHRLCMFDVRTLSQSDPYKF
jgi:hypothetical protein